ncbi:sulfurtransferase [Solemya velum gill symbiont]|uniref:rhodanese-like domain-containing protein n=1 Tax=Solemya velum gill symbiont TaxID=2340 RepID=UPI0009962F07|nr:rhodanese-like domain-containing protein [Solemya velum gill symbiont]OOZ45723.1 sulfurtransferase [Solemya velum gill symbiont]
MKFAKLASMSAIALTLSFSAGAFADSHGMAVGITPTMKKLDFEHNGKKHTISRNQDQKNTVKADFAKTSRKCPPFCIQPISLAPGVETLGEVEVINYIEKMASGDSSILVVDSRTPDWVAKGTIPGAVNLPWTGLNPKKGAKTEGIMKIMQESFNVGLAGDADKFAVDEAIAAGDTSKVFDFSNAKTLVMFCNGMWCGQSPNNIMNLLKFGYPADKIKWYRGGMQDWEILGLSTVKP